MPSKSSAQSKVMKVAAKTKGGFAGIPQKVGKDFAAADKRKAAAPVVKGGRASQSGNRGVRSGKR